MIVPILALTIMSANVTATDNGDGTYTVKMDGEINTEVKYVEAALLDSRSFPEWQDGVKRVDILPNGYVHVTSELPFIGRTDYVVSVKNLELSSGKRGTFSQDWKSMPTALPPASGTTRIDVNDGSWLIRPSVKGCTFTYVNRLSIPVFLPGFIMTMILEGNVPDMVVRLEKRARYLRGKK